MRLAALVPAGAVLHLGRLKDEGLLFYYDGGEARPVRRVADLAGGVSRGWCLLTQAEWDAWPAGADAEVRGRLRDGQGQPLVLVRKR